MSLHAQVSPEAQAALASQRRNSTIAAGVIAILVVLLMCLAFMAFKIFLPNKATETIVAYAGDNLVKEDLVRPKVTSSVKKKPSSPSSASMPVLVTTAISAVAIPTPDVPFDTPSPDIGSGDGFGKGIGDGKDSGFGGPGTGFLGIPKIFQKRCSPKERMDRLKEMGGNAKCEAAVVKTLDWLQRTQNPDGSSGTEYKVAMTGLTLLCYLGHCETPHSPKYGETVEKAIIYLVNNAKKQDGKLASDLKWHGWSYEHAIATYALAEAYTFCSQINYDIPDLKETVLAAGNVLIQGQAPEGGWRYDFSYDGHHKDTSVTGFCMQALKACKHTGLDFPQLKKVTKKGLDYLVDSQNANGQLGYQGKLSPRDTMTGAGLLCMQQWGKGKSREARKALEHLSENVKFSYSTGNIYGHYYYGQVFMEAGGEHWKKYNAMFRDEMLSGQNQDGSYRAGGKTTGGQLLHYRTCMATLSLEVYYRFLPGTAIR